MTEQAPLKTSIRERLIAQIAAGTADVNITEAPFAGTLESAALIADSTITGATATKRTFTIENRGQAGAGTTVMATLDLVTGTNAAGDDETAFVLSATAADLVVAEGDVIAVKEAVTSTGTANPGGLIELVFSRS